MGRRKLMRTKVLLLGTDNPLWGMLSSSSFKQAGMSEYQSLVWTTKSSFLYYIRVCLCARKQHRKQWKQLTSTTSCVLCACLANKIGTYFLTLIGTSTFTFSFPSFWLERPLGAQGSRQRIIFYGQLIIILQNQFNIINH